MQFVSCCGYSVLQQERVERKYSQKYSHQKGRFFWMLWFEMKAGYFCVDA